MRSKSQLWIAIILFTALSSISLAQASYGQSRLLSINYSQVNTSLQDFPVLVYGNYSWLATTGNGGKVSSLLGYDIAFYNDSALSTPIPFCRISWNTTGNVEIRVRPFYNNTPIYIAYGDSGISTDQQNCTGVWNSSYKSVVPGGNTTTVSTTDLTAWSNNATPIGGASIDRINGRIGSALDFNADTDSAQYSTDIVNTVSKNMTVALWLNINVDEAEVVLGRTGQTENRIIGYADWAANALAFFGENNQPGTPPNIPGYNALLNQWHYIVIRYNGSNQNIFLDSVLKGNVSYIYGADAISVYLSDNGNARGLDGQIDDIIFVNGSLSDMWIQTMYANMNEPDRFYSFGNEISAANATLVINSPTTAAPVSVNGGDNITINFTAEKGGTNITTASQLNITNITVGGLSCPIGTTNIAVSCSGSTPACSTYNSNSSACTDISCSYAAASCSGSPAACSSYVANNTCVAAGCGWGDGGTLTVTQQNFTANGTLTLSGDVAWVKIELWGAGGGGGGRGASNGAAGGGGGGAYASTNLSNVAAGGYAVVIGTGGTAGIGTTNGGSGGNTTFNGSTVRANGGVQGLAAGTAGGGGTVAFSVGTITRAGGNGAAGAGSTGGGGGGGSGTTNSGGNASGATAGGGGTSFGGAGGNGGANANGVAGTAPGGGGGGAGRSSGNRDGAAGANGKAIITYAVRNYACSGSPSACNTFGAQGTCQASSCTWNTAACTGTASACSTRASNQTLCNLGCTYNPASTVQQYTCYSAGGFCLANCTTPTGLTGLQTLNLTINYTVDSYVMSAFRMSSVNYGGVVLTYDACFFGMGP